MEILTIGQRSYFIFWRWNLVFRDKMMKIRKGKVDLSLKVNFWLKNLLCLG